MELTQESIQAARQWFADNAQACLDEVQSGSVRVNEPQIYLESCRQRVTDALNGKFDNTFTLQQRAHFIQTGECLPLSCR